MAEPTPDDIEKKRMEVSAWCTKEAEDRMKWSDIDFWKLAVLTWTSLAASFASTIWVSSGVGLSPQSRRRFILASITAVPALIVAIESGFQYSSRWKLNRAAAYDIKLFKLRIDAGENPFLVEKEILQYMKNYSREFPGAAVPQVSGEGTQAGQP